MTDQQDLRSMIERIDQYFRSGNSVPIDKAWIRREDWIALREAAAQLPAGEPEYDRELIAEYLDWLADNDMSPSDIRISSVIEQARLLRAADNRDAEGVHTAKREDGVPDGWVLVPREPTPEMLRAGFLSESEGFDIETPADAPGLVYRAMLAAAPQPDSKESAPVAGSVDDAVLRFVAEIMKYWSEGDLDGGYRQELAVKHGILVPVEVTESCGEYCSCAEYGGFPQTCYRPSPILKAANAALQATRRSDGEKG